MAREQRSALGAWIAVAVLAACSGDSPNDSESGSAVIRIVGLEPGASRVEGTASGVSPTEAKVVLYAKTDQWYVQPLRDAPFTSIATDGTWQNSTHPWSRLAALLVDDTYVPKSTLVTHPASDVGVLAWDEYPTREGDRIVKFAGYDWIVKNAARAGPGPNDFSNSSESVWVDREGLHLATRLEGGRWFTSEVFLPASLGYGTYEFTVATPLDALDFQTVFAGFVYESAEREIDIEFSRLLADPLDAQYVVQPYFVAGNLHRFSTPPAALTSHRFVWTSDRIVFRSWYGENAFPSPEEIFSEWEYVGSGVPPEGGERMHFNLWLFDGEPPRGGKADHVVVRSFRHTR